MTPPSELTSRAVLVVDGDLANIDRAPKHLAVSGPHRRLGLVMNRYYPEVPGSNFFDHDLTLAIAGALASLGDRSVVRFRAGGVDEETRARIRALSPASVRGKAIVLYDLGALATIYRGLAAQENAEDPEGLADPFDELLVFKGDTVVADVRGVDYGKFGGPDPYHDQILWDAYVTGGAVSALRTRLHEAMAALGTKITHRAGLGVPQVDFATRAGDLRRAIFG